MHEGTIAIGILARDCVESLRRNIPRVENLGNFFTDYNVLVYENDSKDGTTELLKEWAATNNHVTAICEQTQQTTIPTKSSSCPYPSKSVARISKMAGFRNRVLSEIKARLSPDYFVFIDIDIEGFSPNSIVEAIRNAPKDWGGLFANGHIYFANSDGSETPSPFQYDSYAFLSNNIDYRNTAGWIISKHFHDITAYVADKNLLKVSYLPCNSAFNGIGVYRWDAIENLIYTIEQTDQLNKVNACFCEHVPFNDAVKKNGYGLYVCRDMEVIYFHKNNTLIRRFTRWRQWLLVKFLLRFSGPYPIDLIKKY